MKAVTVTMDPAGRLVVPKQLRREAGLSPGTPLAIRWCEDHLEIEPIPRKVRLKREGRLTIAEPADSREALSQETVNETLEKIRNRHA